MENNKLIKNILECIILYLILIVVFMLSLKIVCSIPSSAMYENVKKSADTMLCEGNRKIIYIPYRGSELQFDNFTDALMINTAYSVDSTEPMTSALLAKKNYIPGKTKKIEQDREGELKSSSKYQWHDEVGELQDLVNNDVEESFEYARYWHGYLIVLRPLLLFMNLEQIRKTFTIIIVLLFLALIYLLERKTNIIISLIFGIALFCVEYFYLGYTLQGIFVFFIMMVSSIIILLRFEKIKNKIPLFFAIGMLTNFFDFLTVPIITLGIPLTIVLLLNERNNENTFKRAIFEMIQLSISWLFGYAITWATKWMLVDLALKRNLFQIAIQQVLYRTKVTDYPIKQSISANLEFEGAFIYASIIMTMITTFIYHIIYNYKQKIEQSEKNIREIVPYMLIAIIPFAWYIVLKNHSIEHNFFVYRNQILTITGLDICTHKLTLLLIKKFSSNKK